MTALGEMVDRGFADIGQMIDRAIFTGQFLNAVKQDAFTQRVYAGDHFLQFQFGKNLLEYQYTCDNDICPSRINTRNLTTLLDGFRGKNSIDQRRQILPFDGHRVGIPAVFTAARGEDH